MLSTHMVSIFEDSADHGRLLSMFVSKVGKVMIIDLPFPKNYLKNYLRETRKLFKLLTLNISVLFLNYLFFVHYFPSQCKRL